MAEERDHDRLIRIDERLCRMESRICDIMIDHEDRLRRLEHQSWLGWGSLSAAIAMLVVVVKLVLR